jgi:hypothetical protein
MSFSSRVKEAARSRTTGLVADRICRRIARDQFRKWAGQIVSEVGSQSFSVDGRKLKTEVVHWDGEVKIVLMEQSTKWSDVEGKRHHPWFVQIASLKVCNDDLWSVTIHGVGSFHQYADMPEGKKDCYCKPENRQQRIPEIKQMVEDALIRWIE